MPEIANGTAVLNIEEDFPPVTTSAWEAAIQKDLKGADYEKKLFWRTEEGITARPYYRREDLRDLPAQTQTAPGQFPFARGGGKPWEILEEWSPAPGAVRADELHDAGATAVQELGYALAEGVERLAGGAAPREIEFVFAAGPAYFIEIAKLRAARMLWAQAVTAFGIGTDAALMNLTVRTSRRDKSAYDRYTNLLRVTTEALSAAVGGCERLYVEPFGFDPRLAVNVQRILCDEARIDAVADPAGGSYYIEVLTDSLAREAWKLFQQVEAAGGCTKARESGTIGRAVQESRAAREKAVATRRRTLVGVNNYPDLKEKTPGATPPEGSTFRLALPFERIRLRTARHAERTGRYPKVLLLERGDPKMRSARANFSLNFFGCAGFDIAASDDYAGTDADLIVLCSSDAEYLDLAREVCARVSVPVIVAGNPKDQIEALKAADIQGFIHMASDAVRTLTEWQDRLGMEA
jgi:methylmalonyl-CoA mutase